ncbi:beta-ketoacyl-[acyl-carrier-protein] synthase family protein [Myxococcota bacterium]|nr:beta-ketoacyl-[acyl-carrier-protein] synthase family protein [Myxococcota bacterium]
MRRVVITGMGLISPIGATLEAATAALRGGLSGVRARPTPPLGLRAVAYAPAEVDPQRIPRKMRRGMGRQALFAASASLDAVVMAGLDAATLRGGRCGVAVGSTMGSPESQYDYYAHLIQRGDLMGLKGTAFFQVMAHTAAANVALLHGVTGRVISPNSACASATQAIGLAAELIQLGRQDVMICGGADEAHFTATATFELVGGASLQRPPAPTPRPFDRARDGLVIGEGAGILVIEALEHALARGAAPLAEVIGFASTCDGAHLSQPQAEGMAECMRVALDSAGLRPGGIDYINAHATATEVGDIAEAEATRAVFGAAIPISSTKGHTGHTLGACGAIEAIFCVLMMRGGFLAPTLHLTDIDPAAAGLDHITALRLLRPRRVISNNFAFGGINAALILEAD